MENMRIFLLSLLERLILNFREKKRERDVKYRFRLFLIVLFGIWGKWGWHRFEGKANIVKGNKQSECCFLNTLYIIIYISDT